MVVAEGPLEAVPTFVTHYYRADRRPFLNLSDLAEHEVAAVIAELATPEDQQLSARRFGPRYMALRRATERQAGDLFIAAGGRPERSSPHYFVVGASDWLAGLYRDVAEVRLPLAALPPESTSLTYADSITALGLGVAMSLPPPDPDYAGRVYQLADLEQLIARSVSTKTAVSHSQSDYTGHQYRRVDAYVEVQLWSDQPVRTHLGLA